MPRFNSPSPRASVSQQIIESIYGDETGFRIPDEERELIRASGGSPVYGELVPRSVSRFSQRVELSDEDVFYDLGSGIGKVVVQLATEVALRRCVGVELSATRVRQARSALIQARRNGLIIAKKTLFVCDDVLNLDYADATVAYTCSTSFSLKFLTTLARRVARAPKLRWFLTLREIRVPALEKVETMRLDATWCQGVRLHLYRKKPPKLLA